MGWAKSCEYWSFLRMSTVPLQSWLPNPCARMVFFSTERYSLRNLMCVTSDWIWYSYESKYENGCCSKVRTVFCITTCMLVILFNVCLIFGIIYRSDDDNWMSRKVDSYSANQSTVLCLLIRQTPQQCYLRIPSHCHWCHLVFFLPDFLLHHYP